MISRKNSTKAGINAHVGIEPNSAAASNNSISNSVYINTPYPNDVKVKPSTFVERDIELHDIPDTSTERQDSPEARRSLERSDVRMLILETYANILLNQDVALIANLVSKHTIIIGHDELQAIIRCITGNDVDIIVSDDNGCCAKASPIVKVDFIKIITQSGEVITDFKQVFNKEYNELTGKYHLNLKYVVV